MQPHEPYAALPREVVVAQAEGVLAALLDVSLADAATSLDLRARLDGLSPGGAAQQILDDHQHRISLGAPVELDARALAVLRYHLGGQVGPAPLR